MDAKIRTQLVQEAAGRYGTPVVVPECGYKPCPYATKKDQLWRAFDVGESSCICPGCDRGCALPQDIQRGDEFIISRPGRLPKGC